MSKAGYTLALAIVKRLQEAGHTAYFAGGCVRDQLMGNEPKDWDVATSALPDEVGRLFPRSQMVGAAFGVVLVRDRKPLTEGGGQVEVATFRADGAYTDGRHPESVRFTTPEEDAQRRDFTCNGLFFDPVKEQLHDFVGGQRDIGAKVLRAIGVPTARFGEDYLRMLRAVRFAARLGFEVEAGTFAAICAGAANIKGISKERIHDELAKILTHPTRARAAGLLHGSGLLQQVFPAELFEKPEVERQWEVLAALPASVEFALALVALHEDIQYAKDLYPHEDPPGVCQPGQTIAELLRRELLLTNQETADVAWLHDQLPRVVMWRGLDKAGTKRLMADGRWGLLRALYVAFASPGAEVRRAFEEREGALQAEGVAPAPYVNGGTLIRMGVTPGPRFRGWLEQLYDRQLNGEFADAGAAERAAEQLVRGG